MLVWDLGKYLSLNRIHERMILTSVPIKFSGFNKSLEGDVEKIVFLGITLDTKYKNIFEVDIRVIVTIVFSWVLRMYWAFFIV